MLGALLVLSTELNWSEAGSVPDPMPAAALQFGFKEDTIIQAARGRKFSHSSAPVLRFPSLLITALYFS